MSTGTTQTERDLRESEQRLRLILESAKEYAIFTLDLEGRVISWNPGAQRVLGYGGAEIIGKNGRVVFTPEDQAKGIPEQEMQAALRHDRAEDERWHLRKNGERFWGSGLMMPLSDESGRVSGFLKIMQDKTERWLADERLKAALREKEILLREIHHRVKNNFQIVWNLLDMEAEQVKDPQVALKFQDSKNRVQSMSLIREKLYQTKDLTHVDMEAYLRGLSEWFFEAYKPPAGTVELKIDIKSVFLTINSAVPCGLIVNELVSNAFKHAFPGGRQGEVLVKLEELPGSQFMLTVHDTGVGFPEGFSIEKTSSFGLRIVKILVSQLGGSLKFERTGGAAFTMSFSEEEAKPVAA